MEILLHNVYKPYLLNLDYRPIANLFLLLSLVFSVVLSFFSVAFSFLDCQLWL